MAERGKYEVFISYAHQDESWASEFAKALEAQGVHAWFDKADVAFGSRWSEQIEEALRQSRIVVALVSPSYVNNKSKLFELGAAVGDDKVIIPVATQDVEEREVPSLLRNRRWLRELSPQVAGERVAEVVGTLGAH